jgi:hypothetical protein
MVRVKAPSPNRFTACAVLIAFVALCFAVPSFPGAAILLPILLGLFAAELDRTGGVVGVRIVRFGGRLVPARCREPLVDEWVDHVLSAGDAGLRPVGAAFSILIFAALRLAFRLRVRRRIATFLGYIVVSWMRVSEDTTNMLERRFPEAYGPSPEELQVDEPPPLRWFALAAIRSTAALPALPIGAVMLLRGRRMPCIAAYAIGVVLWVTPPMLWIVWPPAVGMVAAVAVGVVGTSSNLLGFRLGRNVDDLARFVRRVAGNPTKS